MVNKVLSKVGAFFASIVYVFEFCFNVFRYYLVCLRHLEKPSRLSYVHRVTSKRLAVLANGPSLKELLDDIKSGLDISQWDFSCMNYFGEHELFTQVKPKYYCFADPMFFMKDNRYDKVQHLFKTLNEEVDWDMTLFIPSCFSKKMFMSFSGLANPHCKVESVRYIIYQGSFLKHWLYKLNFAMPNIPTVAVLNVYSGINLGYTNIDLYGADMTFLDSLCVDENNRLCNKIKHFYDDEPQLKPITFGDGESISAGFYLKDVSGMFYGHYDVAEYSKYLGSHVINRSKASLLDCYDRL